MLKRLSFTNFKAWRKADLECARVTGLFGTNSSGKTSILQFLLMLKQTKEATDRALSLELNGEYVQLGTFIDTIHRHDEKSVIAINAEFVRDNMNRPGIAVQVRVEKRGAGRSEIRISDGQ